jgi:branched-chain amino acid aminotransferase
MAESGTQVYLNGEIVDASAARVGVFDAALLHGVGLFETLRAYDGHIFRLDAHLARMAASADQLRLPFTVDLEMCRGALKQVLLANNLRDARLRLTITPGQTLVPNAPEADTGPTVLATATALAAYPQELYEKGMTVLVAPHRQSATDPLAGHKTTSYWTRLIALRKAQDAKCGEALWFTPQNRLAEGSISNVFVVKGDVLKTPPLDTPVLPGIARAVVLEAAAAEGRAAEETALTIDDLLDADEVFLTNSIMEVMPVCRVERKAIGAEKPGPVTAWATAAYRRAVAGEA